MKLTLVELALILSGFATTALVGFVAYQIHQAKQQMKITRTEVDMTKQQMDSSLRPWIGAEKGLVEEKDGTLLFHYQNYGQLPPKSLKLKVWASGEEIKREKLVELEGEEWPHIGIIMPDQIKAYILGLTGIDLIAVKKGQANLWTALVLNYDYADNKKGEYGVIYEYLSEFSHYSIRNEWFV